MFCSACGAPRVPGTRFCATCGGAFPDDTGEAPVTESQTPPTPPAPPGGPYGPPVSPPAAPEIPPTQPVATAAAPGFAPVPGPVRPPLTVQEQRRIRWLSIAIIVLLMASLLVTVILLGGGDGGESLQSAPADPARTSADATASTTTPTTKAAATAAATTTSLSAGSRSGGSSTAPRAEALVDDAMSRCGFSTSGTVAVDMTRSSVWVVRTKVTHRVDASTVITDEVRFNVNVASSEVTPTDQLGFELLDCI